MPVRGMRVINGNGIYYYESLMNEAMRAAVLNDSDIFNVEPVANEAEIASVRDGFNNSVVISAFQSGYFGRDETEDLEPSESLDEFISEFAVKKS